MPERHDPKKATKGECFCFALMLPGSYEQELLKFQYTNKANIFGCDASAVYSSKVIEVTPGLKTRVVDSDLKCKVGGEFGTALNTEIFMAVWKRVITDMEFDDYRWCIKADPDTVFIYSRLVKSTKDIEDTEDGVYLNNCKFGMHGPLEVFSRNAIWSWGYGAKSCFIHFYNLCSGPCLWGEDLFVDQCLSRKLHLDRRNVYELLTEDHCDPPDGWEDCKDEKSVAFHPYKKMKGYKRCLGNSQPDKYPELANMPEDDDEDERKGNNKEEEKEDENEDKEDKEDSEEKEDKAKKEKEKEKDKEEVEEDHEKKDT
eukprot:UN0811